MSVADVLATATTRLTAAGVDSPRADAEWLLAIALGVGRAALRVDGDRLVPAEAASRYADAIERRAAREPMQRIVGWEEFRGLRMALTPDVLVPRPETEMLVEWALTLLPPRHARRLRVVDVGTGSGCIACAIAYERPDADVLALDVSSAAASVARVNAASLNLALRVRVVVGSLAGALAPASADLIVANLPYLTRAEIADLQAEVRDHEPRLALDGGADGLAAMDALLPDALRALRPGGWLILETGGEEHVAALDVRMRDTGFGEVVPHADLAGVTRFVAARRPGTARS